MTSRWVGVALMAAGLGFTSCAAAQYQAPIAPMPFGAARLPEPVPLSPSTVPMMPGPLNSQTLPPGWGPELSLPGSHSGAFQLENAAVHPNVYLHAGAIGLQRSGFGDRALAVRNGVPPTVPDSGIGAPASAPIFATLGDVPGHLGWGAFGTIGYLHEDTAVELTGFYMFDNLASYEVGQAGQIDTYFFNPPNGFTGDNGLFRQASRLTTERRTNLGNVELNYRYTNKAVTDFELILGLRYIDFSEDLDITTDDGGNAGGRGIATYQTRTHNHVFAPQIGFEFDTLVCKWLSAGIYAKSAYGVVYAEGGSSLMRGDGFLGFDVTQRSLRYHAMILDAGGFVEVHPTERMRIRGGYNFLGMMNVADVQDLINFNLGSPGTEFRVNGNLFFHGPTIELQLLF